MSITCIVYYPMRIKAQIDRKFVFPRFAVYYEDTEITQGAFLLSQISKFA